MVEDQLARNKRLLALKGVVIEEEEPTPEVDTDLILQQYQEKKQSRQDRLDELEMLEKKALELLIEAYTKRIQK